MTGVATTLKLAETLATADVEYNIIIAFWGSEENGLFGSSEFVSDLSKDQFDEILLYVNLDSLAVGDNQYIFTNELSDPHEEMFFEEAEKNSFDLERAPSDKKYSLPMQPERPFSHIGIQSDNYHFMINEVMVANFISYVWGEEGINHETVLHDNIMHTENDNSEYIFSMHQKEEIANNLEGVYNTVYSTLMRDDFVENMVYSKANSSISEIYFDTNIATIACVGIALLFVLALLLVSKKLRQEVKSTTEVGGNDQYGSQEKIEKAETVEIFGEKVEIPKKQQSGGENKKPPENPFKF